MSHPHVDQTDRDAIEDRGLVENDRTPDMRKAPVAAGALRNDHLAVTTTTQEIRTMTTVPTTATTPVPLRPQCRHCTVHTDGTEVCAFCASYSPPETVAQKIDTLVNRVDIVRHDGNEVLRQLPADAPLFAVTDLVVALNHLKRAAVALDKASDALEADTQAVKR